jgi:hypothetical protein
LEPEVVARLDELFFKFLQRICSDCKRVCCAEKKTNYNPNPSQNVLEALRILNCAPHRHFFYCLA